MSRRLPTDENDAYQIIKNSQRCFLNEPITRHIMKEMDLTPLDPESFMDECNFEPDELSQKKPFQMIGGSKGPSFVIPERKSPTLKSYRDHVLLQKSPHHCLQGEDPFAYLSDEVILHIFQYLPKGSLVKCAAVCKRWKTISYDESLWARFDFGKKFIQPGVLETLLLRGVVVLRLAMCEIKSPIFIASEFASRQRFTKLQYLDLSMATLSSEALANLFAVCISLRKLSLEACILNEDCCKFIAQNEGLEVLNMCMCSGLTPLGLKTIATKCIKLKEWNLAWTHLNASCMRTFLPLLPNSLIRLNVCGHRITVNDNALITVVDRCPDLIELDISDCSSLTEVSYLLLLERCKKLERLHISRCFNIPTECSHQLKDLKNFKNLEIFRTLKDDALAELRELLPNIKINSQPFTTIARPTTGCRRTSIWGIRVRD